MLAVRVGEPADLAATHLHLMANGFTTGTVFCVGCGGGQDEVEYAPDLGSQVAGMPGDRPS